MSRPGATPKEKKVMSDSNEQKMSQSSSETNSKEGSFSTVSPGAAPARQPIDLTGFFSRTMLKDFLDFKIMIIPIVVKYIYLLAVVLCSISSFAFCARLWNGFGLLLLPLVLLLNIIILHIICEFLMLGFAVLDTLRQIRNELMKQ